jgi:hypothetical protein
LPEVSGQQPEVSLGRFQWAGPDCCSEQRLSRHPQQCYRGLIGEWELRGLELFCHRRRPQESWTRQHATQHGVSRESGAGPQTL